MDVALLFIDPAETDSREEIRVFAGRLGVPATYFYHDALGRLTRKFFKGRFVFPTIVGIKSKQIVFRTHVLDEKAVNSIGKMFD